MWLEFLKTAVEDLKFSYLWKVFVFILKNYEKNDNTKQA